MGRWLDRGARPHRCPVPGVFERWGEHIKAGAIWQCTEMVTKFGPGNSTEDPNDLVKDECGVMWMWQSDQEGPYWSRMYDKLPQVPDGPAPGAKNA